MRKGFLATAAVLTLAGLLLTACQPAAGIPGLGEEPVLVYFYATW